MSLSKKKKQELFDYYSENGFHHSTEQIVHELNICHKTFFNRYGTKAHSIDIAWSYWQDICKEKWHNILQNCNHSVEELTMIMFNISKTRYEEPHYYAYTRDNRKYLENNSIFYQLVHSVLEKGKQCFHIQEDLDLDTYVPYLLNNLFFVDTWKENNSQVIRYVLHPALTERGMDLFMETPFA